MSPFIIVIFGATGDLARHKLLPALYTLYKQQVLPEEFFIIGFSRRDYSDKDFRDYINADLPEKDKEQQRDFLSHLYYQQGFFDEPQGYDALIKKLNTFDEKMGACITRIFYLATPPHNYEPILKYLETTDLAEGCGQGSDKWTRIAIEKPFGKDLETARLLDQRLIDIFKEKQIYRVDHYLGKETVQNMITFRFANGIFESVWNKSHIDHVQITFAEQEGVRTRGKFFDGVGILRDVAQNHLMQLIATVVMEQPKSFEREGIRDARAQAIKSLRLYTDDVAASVVRGQYHGYAAEKDVAKNSQTETFVAMKLMADTDRFRGVPFYVRAGKKMPKETVEISLVFKQTAHAFFKDHGLPEIGNVLTIRIQPNEGIVLRLNAKTPGTKQKLSTVDMHFSYEEEFHSRGSDAYEKVLMDIFGADQMLFNRSDELESSWELITTVLKSWEKENSLAGFKTQQYEEGIWGTKEANELIEKDGKKWIE
jgi:glucose-6-phosphate 1-dehydrogenase